MIKIVLFGYSKTGREIAKILHKDKYDLSIIDKNPLHVTEASEDGYFARHSTFNDDKKEEEKKMLLAGQTRTIAHMTLGH